jgi:hypothetical protein
MQTGDDEMSDLHSEQRQRMDRWIEDYKKLEPEWRKLQEASHWLEWLYEEEEEGPWVRGMSRDELLKAWEQFANEPPEIQKLVRSWLD